MLMRKELAGLRKQRQILLNRKEIYGQEVKKLQTSLDKE